MPNRTVFAAVCLAAALMLSAPVSAQPVLLGEFAQIPAPQVTEAVVGLIPFDSQLVLITTQRIFYSPFFPAPGLFTDINIQWATFQVHMNPASQVINGPAGSSEIWLTGAPPRGGSGVLYTVGIINLTTGNPTITVANQVTLPSVLSLGPLPSGLTSDGSAVYMAGSGHVVKVDPSTGNVLFDLDPTKFIATPQRVALGPDGLLYVLDSSSSTGRIVSFDTSGNLKNQFPLSQPSVFVDSGPMAISATGQLYSLSTDSTGTLGIDTYDTRTGKFLGRVSGAGTFSGDQGFNLGGQPAMLINGSYLYFTTGTGKYVWIFSIAFSGTPGAPDCHGKTVLSLAQQYGYLANAAAALGFPSVDALQAAITNFCGN